LLQAACSSACHVRCQFCRQKIFHHNDDNASKDELNLDVDELVAASKLYDEAKALLENACRKRFHKLPPDNWHLTNTTNCKPKRQILLDQRLFFT